METQKSYLLRKEEEENSKNYLRFEFWFLTVAIIAEAIIICKAIF